MSLEFTRETVIQALDGLVGRTGESADSALVTLSKAAQQYQPLKPLVSRVNLDDPDGRLNFPVLTFEQALAIGHELEGGWEALVVLVALDATWPLVETR